MKNSTFIFLLFHFCNSFAQSQKISDYQLKLFIDRECTLCNKSVKFIDLCKKYSREVNKFLTDHEKEYYFKMSDSADANLIFALCITEDKSAGKKIYREQEFIILRSIKDTIWESHRESEDIEDFILDDNKDFGYDIWAKDLLVSAFSFINTETRYRDSSCNDLIMSKPFKSLRNISVDEIVQVKGAKDPKLGLLLTDFVGNILVANQKFDESNTKFPDKSKRKFLFERKYLLNNRKNTFKSDITISAFLNKINSTTYECKVDFKGKNLSMSYLGEDKEEPIKSIFYLNANHLENEDYTEFIVKTTDIIIQFLLLNFSL
jgi:hypothetical protein